MKRSILILFLLVSALSFAQINFDNSYSSIGGDIHAELIIEGANSTYYGLGDDVLIQIDQNGNLLFAKDIECSSPVDFTFNSSHELFYGQVKTDINGNDYSILSKRNELGNLIWERRLGSGYEELRIGAVYANNDQTIIIGGALKTNSIWHNFLSKFSENGTELWTRKFEHYDYINQVKVHKTVQVIKITHTPGGYYYALSKINNNTLIYLFQGDGSLNGFYEYSYEDSLIPVDIISVSEDDIQVLCTNYSLQNDSPERSIVKFRTNTSLSNYHARQYKKADVLLSAVDLDYRNGQCFILGNGLGSTNFTLIERTTPGGYHNQTREVLDQNWGQAASSLVTRDDQSVVYTYRLEQDSTSIISATNSDLRSACDFYLGDLENSSITVTENIATSLKFSAGDPLEQNTTTITNNLNGLASVNHCFGAIGIEEEKSEFKVYPNPATDYVNIEFNSAEDNRVKITNASGSIVFNDINPGYICLSDFSSGIYLIQFKNEKEIITKRLVIQK